MKSYHVRENYVPFSEDIKIQECSAVTQDVAKYF